MQKLSALPKQIIGAFRVALLGIVLVAACAVTEVWAQKKEIAPESIQSIREKAELGDAKAQALLGLAYYQGRGVPKDIAKAAQWYRHAAEQGHAEAQFSLGLMYALSMRLKRLFADPGYASIPEDTKEAAKLYRRAAKQGHAAAQAMLGRAYLKGKGVLKNYEMALEWSRRSAKQGDAKAQVMLGMMYAKGKGIPQNYTDAVKWYRRAAEQGENEAQYNLGMAYWDGQGVQQNDREAYIWMSLAAVKGESFYHTALESQVHPVEKRDIFAEKLSPTDLSFAQEESARRYIKIQGETGD